MSHKKRLILFTSLVCVTRFTQATPTNEQLYQIILDVQKEQQRLSSELNLAKQRESELEQELKITKEKLKLATEDLNVIPTSLSVKGRDKLLPEGFKFSAGTVYAKPTLTGTYANITSSDYMAGFQISANHMTTNNWDYAIKYQSINSTSTSTSTSGSFSNTTVISGELLTPPTFNYKLDYNLIDLEVGKHLVLSDSTMMRFSGGLRYMSMVQTLSTSSVADSAYYTRAPYLLESSNSTWGVGPRITASSIWKPLDKNLRIFGNLGVSTLTGAISERYLSEDNDVLLTIVETGGGIGYTIKNNLIDLDLEAGYRYESWINDFSSFGPRFTGMHGAYGTVGIYF